MGTPNRTGTNWPEALAPRRLSYRHHTICALAAIGCTAAEISRRVGITQGRLSILLNNSRFLEEISRIRKELIEQDFHGAARSLMPKSLEVIKSVLENPQARESLKVDTAFRIWERVEGKPRQPVEADTAALKDLFELMDKRSDERARELVDAQRTIDVSPRSSDTGSTYAHEESDKALVELYRSIDSVPESTQGGPSAPAAGGEGPELPGDSEVPGIPEVPVREPGGGSPGWIRCAGSGSAGGAGHSGDACGVEGGSEKVQEDLKDVQGSES